MFRQIYIEEPSEPKWLAILRVLAEATEPLGAGFIAGELETYGYEITERGVRYHLGILDERGLTQCIGERGRLITEKGLRELGDARVSQALGSTRCRIAALAYRTTFSLDADNGEVPVDLCLLPRDRLADCLDIVRPLFAAGYCISDLVRVVAPGRSLGEQVIHNDQVGLATISDVLYHALLLQHRVSLDARYAGLALVKARKLCPFSDCLCYADTTIDPGYLFLQGGMTRARAAATGDGNLLAGLHEVPAVALPGLMRVLGGMKARGFRGVLAVGQPGQRLLGVPVGGDRLGIALVDGLNVAAALREAGIATNAMSRKCLVDITEMGSVWDNVTLP